MVRLYRTLAAALCLCLTAPVHADEPPLPKLERLRRSHWYTPPEESSGHPDDSVPSTNQTEEKTGVRWSLGAGPVMVLGVATWMPAVGLSVVGSLKPSDYFSMGLEGRAVWPTAGIADRPIDAMMAAAIVSMCGHWRWVFGCGLGHLGVINVTMSAASYKGTSDTGSMPGMGGRVGAKLDITPSFGFRAAMDVIGLRSGTLIFVEKTELTRQPPILIGFSIVGEKEF